jgi:hypothetical protein
VLVVSQENSCCCYAAARMMLWAQGLRRERILRIERDAADARLDPRLRDTLEFGRLPSRRGPDGARTAWTGLRRAGVGVEELKEIAFTVALTDFNNRLNSIPAIPTQMLERLITDAVRDELGDAFVLEAMPPEVVKGIAEPVRTHAVRGQSTPPAESM